MNLTVAKIKKILEQDYGWNISLSVEDYEKLLIDELIKDVAKIVEDELTRKNNSSTPKVPPHSEYPDIEADGIVFCGKCGKQK